MGQNVADCVQMKGHGSKFGRKKDEAIAALLTQRNIEDAAKAVGIAPNTLLKWMKDAEFDRAYRVARRATFSQSVARLQQADPAAVTTLLKTLVDASAPPSVPRNFALAHTHLHSEAGNRFPGQGRDFWGDSQGR
jgi:transposase-like protein